MITRKKMESLKIGDVLRKNNDELFNYVYGDIVIYDRDENLMFCRSLKDKKLCYYVYNNVVNRIRFSVIG